jgi:hypothetical protein
MTVTIKDPPKSTTKVLLKDAKPFEKYATADGVIFEVCASPKVLEQTGKLAAMKRTNGNIFVYLIDKNGERRKNSKGEDQYTELAPDLELDSVARRGPKRRNDGLRWRGWGRKNFEKMDSLTKIVAEEGFYINWPTSRKNHYANIGFESNKPCSLFFSGELGFSQKPEGALGAYPFTTKLGFGYMPIRIVFAKVTETGNKAQWSEFETVFRRQLKDWKRSYVAARTQP